MHTSADIVDASKSILLTDFYQLTMLQACEVNGMRGEASFELSLSSLPASRGFVMSCGLEPALDWLEGLRFQDSELAWLAASRRFRNAFIEGLRDWRFSGEVWAVPEGTVVFPGEPVLRITAPIGQAQLVESRLLNLIHVHSVIASKAARCVIAAGSADLVDLGLQRAPGSEAAMITSRAACIAGFSATANVLAGMQSGLALAGTMAQSYVFAHEAETLAFLDFARANPDDVVFLIDTWDTVQGAYRAVSAAEELAREGIRVKAVRIDSGDLLTLSHRVRAILDNAGLSHVRIFAGNNLDEWQIAALRAATAPIDTYCVGTALSTSVDAPSIDFSYKLVDYGGRPCGKRSSGKATPPGRKQIWRHLDESGKIARDLVSLDNEPAPANAGGRWQALLEPVMRAGRRLRPAPSLDTLRARAASQIALLGNPVRLLDNPSPVPVSHSATLRESLHAQVASGLSSPVDPNSARPSRSAIARQDSPEGGRSTRMRSAPQLSKSRRAA